MVSVYLPTPDANKAKADLWAQDARQTVADQWEQQVRAQLPDLITQAQAKLPQLPTLGLGTAPTTSQPASSPIVRAPGAPPTPAPATLPFPPQPTPTTPAAAPTTPSPAAENAQGGDLRSFARSAAQQAGIDPGIFEAQIQQESGFDPNAKSPAGAQGIAQFMPATAQGLGIDPLDPYAALTGAAKYMRSLIEKYGGDVAKALAAYNAGPGNVDKYGGIPPFEETQRYVKTIMGSAGGGQQAASAGQPQALAGQRTSQFALGLSTQDAYAACGPTAAIAFANTYGRNPTAQEALDLAKKYGWTQDQGMAGIQSEQQLLSQGLGIPTKLEQDVNWAHVASDAQSGNPVIISTPGHYFYVSLDPQTGKAMDDQGRLYVGTSGTDLKGGSAWMTPEQIQAREGKAQGALYANNPQSPQPSIATQVANAPVVGGILQGAQKLSNNLNLPDITSTLTSGPQAQLAQRLQNPQTAQQQPVQTARDIYRGFSGAQQEATRQINPLRDVPVLGGAINMATNPANYLPFNAPGIAGGAAVGGLTGYMNAPLGATPGEEALSAGTGALFGAGVGALTGGAAQRAAQSPQGQALIHSRQAGGGRPFDFPSGASVTPPPAEHGLTINLPKYVPPEVRDIIQQTYDKHPELYDTARRGVIPDQAVQDLARFSGITPDDVVRRFQAGKAYNAETILSMRQALADTSLDAVKAQQALKANPNDMQAANSMLSAFTRQAAVQEAVTGATAEAGRALRQFRFEVAGMTPEASALAQLQAFARRYRVEPDELAQLMAKIDLSDPMAVAAAARSLVKFTPGDKLSALWYFNLLTSPLSHIRNVVSNAITMTLAPVESLGAAGADVARAAATGAPRERYAGEAGARLVGIGAGFREGVTNAMQIIRYGFTQGQAAGQLLGTGAEREALGPVIGMPGRFLGAEDAFFRAMNKTSALYALAYRQAKSEGLAGQALAQRIADLRLDPKLLTQAGEEAAYRVFQNPNRLASGISQLERTVPPLRAIMPFVRTPINIANYLIESSPLGVAKLAYDIPRGTVKGAGAVEDRLARAGIGTALMAWAVNQGMDGNITGPAPQQAGAERDAFLQLHPEYSIKVGDQWVSYTALQPYSGLFAAGAAVADAVKRGEKVNEGLPVLVSMAMARQLLDMPWTQGLADTLDAMQDPTPGKLGRITQQYATSAIPASALMRFLATASDSLVRQPQGIPEALQANMPILSQNVPARLTTFGAPVQRPAEQQGLGALNPFRPAPATPDPVVAALSKLQARGYTVLPGFVGNTQSISQLGGVQVELSREEQRQVQTDSGQLAYAILAPIVTDPNWDQLPPDKQAEIVNSVISKSRNYARTKMLPTLVPRGIEAFQQQAATGVRKPAARP